MKKKAVDEVSLQEKTFATDNLAIDQSLLSSILNSFPHAIISMDLNLRVQFCNDKASQLLGISSEQIIGQVNPLGLDYSIIKSQEKNLFSNKIVPFDSVKSSLPVSNSVAVSSTFTDGSQELDISVDSATLRQALMQDSFTNNSDLLKITADTNFDTNPIKESQIKGYISGMLDELHNPIGYSCFLRQVKTAVESSALSRKRTFDSIRLLILSELLSHRKTINQISKNISVNWKTVESHLTYLTGRKLIHEVFTSDYVRIFEITDAGKLFLQEQSSTVMKTTMRTAFKSNESSSFQAIASSTSSLSSLSSGNLVSNTAIQSSSDITEKQIIIHPKKSSSDQSLNPTSSNDDDLLREVGQ